jgi:hypothetical protein
VAYLQKAIIVETEQQPLLVNGSETTFVSRQRLGKHIPAPTDKHATIDVMLVTVFSTRSVQRGWKKDSWGNRINSVRGSVKKIGSLKEAAIQRRLKPGSRGLAIV